jgi:lipopolysaccharide/colanic/teichoic acid biosynthesis glycosyltransferase
MDFPSSEHTVQPFRSEALAKSVRQNLADFGILGRREGHRSAGFYAGTGKRVLDIVAAALLLIVTAPLFALIALVILCVDGFPVVFAQERIGQDFLSFRMFKFRTMRQASEQMLAEWRAADSPLWHEYVSRNFKIANDPRILPFGSFLRRYSLDELPQLLNVLRGEMSMVGPRPLPRIQYDGDFAEATEKAIRVRSSARPGITGFWQISGRSTTTFEQLLDYDVRYTSEISFSNDIFILFNTIAAVLKGDGAV